NLNTSKDSKAIPTMASVTDPKIVKPQHSESVLAKDHARPTNQKKGKEREESVESNITEAKRKREDLSLLGDKEGKPKVNRSFGQRIIKNTVKLAEHNSQLVKKDYEKENQPPKTQRKTKPIDNSDPNSNNSIHNML
ncbi:3978_t:CDS:2, partial [Dentiscutata erythropus]